MIDDDVALVVFAKALGYMLHEMEGICITAPVDIDDPDGEVGQYYAYRMNDQVVIETVDGRNFEPGQMIWMHQEKLQ